LSSEDSLTGSEGTEEVPVDSDGIVRDADALAVELVVPATGREHMKSNLNNHRGIACNIRRNILKIEGNMNQTANAMRAASMPDMFSIVP